MDMCVRESLDGVNCNRKTHSRCGWYHCTGKGPGMSTQEKASQAAVSLCFLIVCSVTTQLTLTTGYDVLYLHSVGQNKPALP